MSDSLTLPAPAKLNLMLHITGRRDDGYHELQTLFQLLDAGDQLTFTPDHSQNTATVALEDNSNLPLQDNLVTRAAVLIAPYATRPCPVRITLYKHLPMGGGLGGGSSDAATTLLALNALWQCRLDADQLAALGQTLGADVPVFVRGRTAWGEGTGERLTPVDTPERWFVVAHPGVQVSTAEVFGAPGLTRNSQKTTIRSALEGGGHNDCEPVVRAHYPAIDQMLKTMSEYGDARLTGTGACGFVPFVHESDAWKAATAIGQHYSVFTALGINQSPVLNRLPSSGGTV